MLFPKPAVFGDDRYYGNSGLQMGLISLSTRDKMAVLSMLSSLNLHRGQTLVVFCNMVLKIHVAMHVCFIYIF